MGISCDCEFESESGAVIWYSPDDYSILTTKKRKRCCSCKELININDVVGEFNRAKIPDSDIEINIYGEDGEIPRASHYMCEKCSDIYFSISELGFCIDISRPMNEALNEYKDYVATEIEWKKRQAESEKKRAKA